MNSSDFSEKRLLYEDSLCGVYLADPPVTLGHIKIIAKREGLLEELTDEQVERLFVLANVCASALFEMLGAQGTNIIFDEWIRERNVSKHAIIHVIARFQEDGMSYMWQPKQMQDAELGELQKKIKHKTIFINMKEKRPQMIDLDEKRQPREATKEECARLRRIP